jgi:hypothetical protein
MILAGLAAPFQLSPARLSDSRFAGFVMRRVPDRQPVHELYFPMARWLH